MSGPDVPPGPGFENEGIAAVVLAAGAGMRLRPLTDVLPKALCPVGNVPLVDHALARVSDVTGARAVNAWHHAARLVEHLAGKAHISVEEHPLGTAGALGALRGWLDGRDVLVCNADAWHPSDLGAFVADWDRSRVRLRTVRDPVRGDFGDLRYAGASLIPWTAVRDLRPEPAGLYATIWGPRFERGELDLWTAGGPFTDCGTPADYLDANLQASGGESVVADPEAIQGEVVRSVVWAGARVGRGERLVDSIRARDDVTVRIDRGRFEG